jgi:hypothetical protein
MDDLEFRKRAFSNPRDNEPDFVNALKDSTARRKLLEEISALDDRLTDALNNVEIPLGLADRLKQHAPGTASASTPGWRRYSVIAASLFIAVAVTLSVGLPDRPNAQDLALHDTLVSHLYHEEPHYAGEGTNVSWERMEHIIVESGGRIHDNQVIRSQHLRFANDCNFGNAVTGAHIVIQGEKGPVSVIFLKAAPVSKAMQISDDRFAGRIIPIESGNLAIAGEKDESLDRWENLAAQTFEWSI